jgi:hypothetical protein
MLMRFSSRWPHSRRLPCGPSIDVPPEIWDATNVVVATGVLASYQRQLFDGIEAASTGSFRLKPDEMQEQTSRAAAGEGRHHPDVEPEHRQHGRRRENCRPPVERGQDR